MATDQNQRRRHEILDSLFQREEGYTVANLVETLSEEYGMLVTERTIKSDLKTFREEYHAEFDDLPKAGKSMCYRYADRDFSLFEHTLSQEDRLLLAELLGRLREYRIISNDPNYSYFVSLLEHVITHRTARDLELEAVQFSNNPELRGLEQWFRPLLSAITDKRPVRIAYRPFGKELREYNLSPYLLKQFNERWFLIAKNADYETLSTFALDRIEKLTFPGEATYVPADIREISQRFMSVYGVSGALDKEVSAAEVVLKVAGSWIDYIQTKPVNPMQEVEPIEGDPEHFLVRLPDMIVNKELVSLILSYGSDAEVLSPLSLRERVAGIIGELQNRYAGK